MELALDPLVMDRRAGTAFPSPDLRERGSPSHRRAQSPRGPFTHRLAGSGCLVGEKAMPEFGIIAMGIEQRVHPMGLFPLAVSDGRFQPPVVLGAAEFQDPTRHRHGDPVDGQLADEREHHFPGRFAWDR